jgi:hypothetical protein
MLLAINVGGFGYLNTHKVLIVVDAEHKGLISLFGNFFFKTSSEGVTGFKNINKSENELKK